MCPCPSSTVVLASLFVKSRQIAYLCPTLVGALVAHASQTHPSGSAASGGGTWGTPPPGSSGEASALSRAHRLPFQSAELNMAEKIAASTGKPSLRLPELRLDSLTSGPWSLAQLQAESAAVRTCSSSRVVVRSGLIYRVGPMSRPRRRRSGGIESPCRAPRAGAPR